MASLSNYRKVDLQNLAEELGVDILSTDRVIDIISKIEGDSRYNKEMALNQAKLIQEERLAELELEELKRKEELEYKREADNRAFELERLRLTQMSETNSIASSGPERVTKNRSLKNIMPKFDSTLNDMALYLTLFQRQAKKIELDEDEYVTQLLALMPVEVSEILLRLPETETETFDQVKKILLDRFKLSPEAFRHKFLNHQKGANKLWKDFVFELSSYLSGWLESLEITDFDKLKDLLIAEQIKERCSADVRNHFIDNWTELIEPNGLATKVDEYEAVRKNNRKFTEHKPVERPDFKRTPSFRKNEERKYKGSSESGSWRDKSNNEKLDREKFFEKRKSLACYECNSPSHLRPQCPKLRKTESVNNIEIRGSLSKHFEPYLSKGKVNNKVTRILRDTGSSIDVGSINLIGSDSFNGEYVWVKQALSNDVKCLPLANVELELAGVGKFMTKTAVLESNIEMKHYILGNQTQELIESLKTNSHQINAITKSREKSQKDKNRVKVPDNPREKLELSRKSEFHPKEGEKENTLTLPPVKRDGSLELLEIGKDEFQMQQESDETLKGLWEKEKNVQDSEFKIENGLLFRVAKNKKMGTRKQLIIPWKFREKILRLCHEEISAHLGTAKTKDKVLRHYFWPNVVKDADTFVQTCEPCQCVGPGEKGKKLSDTNYVVKRLGRTDPSLVYHSNMLMP